MHHGENIIDLIVNFPQHRSRVSFATQMEVTIVTNLSHEHKTDLWYTDFELKSFKRDAALLLLSIASSGMTVAQYAEMHVNDTSAFLGIENYLSTATRREVTKRRQAIVDAVLLEQERQQRFGDIDEDKMADISQSCKQCRRCHLDGQD